MYLWWFDDNPRKSAADKIKEAVNAYIERSGIRPTVALVNAADLVEVDGLVVLAESYIRRHNFWIGRDG